MNATTRQSPMMKSQHPNNPLWHGLFAFPCIRPDTAPSFTVGLPSYRGHPPDSC
jgi:hypothetical protein